ncbi:MAG: NAD(P)/FAD-dependent oxidoreductase [Pseudomonadales bacterium]
MTEEHTDYDIIIIGAGVSGGLPAAAYLQKAGAKVLMIDANHEAGTHVKVHEYFTGATCVPCAGGFIGSTNPYWDDLELEKYGAELILNKRGTGMIFPDETSLFIGPADPEGTVQALARYSQKDAETMIGWNTRAAEVFVEVNELLFFRPPTPERLELIYEKLAYVAGIAVEDFTEMNGWEFVDRMFEDHRIKQLLLVAGEVSWVFTDVDARGEGPVGIVGVLFMGLGQLKGSNHMVVHALLRVFSEYGGTLWKNTKVDEIVIENGKAVGVRLADDAVMHPGEVIRAKHGVISNVGAKATYNILDHEILRKADPVLENKMRRWDMVTRPSTVTVWVLKEPPKFKAATTDSYVNQADWIFKGLDSVQSWKDWNMAMRCDDLEGAFGENGGWWEIFLPGLIDPTQRSPEGPLTLRIEEVLPYRLRDEDGKANVARWEKEKWDLVARREEILEEMAPGFKDLILDRVASSPVDLARSNMTAVNGCAQGGVFHGDQNYLGRMPYRMPIDNLYMCNSVWPASLTVSGTGYNVACIVAEDMGIREQDWWVGKPGQWFLENIPRLVPERLRT